MFLGGSFLRMAYDGRWNPIDVLLVAVPPESENEETGDNEEVEANADKDKEPEDDPELVRDCQKENGD